MYTVPTTAVNQPDGMAYYTNSKSEENISLSCRQGPIRFEVMRKNGLNSYTWKVWVGGDGERPHSVLDLTTENSSRGKESPPVQWEMVRRAHGTEEVHRGTDHRGSEGG